MSSISRETNSKAEVPRKVLHILVALAPLMAIEVGRQTTAAVIVPLAVAAVLADLVRSRSASFEARIQSLFGFMMRPSESISGSVVINGATWVLVSFAVLVLVFPFRLGAQALFIFMLADAVAALVGRRIGKHPWPQSHRTIEGTVAFIVVGIAAGVLFPGVGLRPVIAAVLVGAAAEIPRRPLNDNVRVPVVIAVVLLAAQNYFP